MTIQATHKYESDVSRRKQLINSTIQTIAESGLSAVTLAKVASQAGLSPGIVNFYFKSKKQLLLDTLKYIDQEYLSVVATSQFNRITSSETTGLHSSQF